MWAVVVEVARADVAETSGATLLTRGRVGGCWGMGVNIEKIIMYVAYAKLVT